MVVRLRLFLLLLHSPFYHWKDVFGERRVVVVVHIDSVVFAVFFKSSSSKGELK